MKYPDPDFKSRVCILPVEDTVDYFIVAMQEPHATKRIRELQQVIATATAYLQAAEDRVRTSTEEARPMTALSFIRQARHVLQSAVSI